MNSTSTRVASIDIMRGLTLCLMLFVNDLYVPGVPHWMIHTQATEDGMGLADWVFPGFLFMVGLSIPYAIEARKKKGDGLTKNLWHVLLRSISLLLIGVLILNGTRLNPTLTGMPELVWTAGLYISIFLVWNAYPSESKFKKFFTVLKTVGVLGLLYLAFIFKAGTAEETSWLETGWWGILGLIGWGYLTASLVYLLISERIIPALLAWAFFVLLNILTQLHWLRVDNLFGKIFGIVLDGNTPSLVLAGLTTGILIRKNAANKTKLIKILAAMGVVCALLGFVLRHWFILSKIYGTPSWAMVCNGISLLVLSVVYYVTDMAGKEKWAWLFTLAGKNSLTTYLAPDLIYFACWGLNIPLFFYKQDASMMLAVGGSVVWAVAMVFYSYALTKIGIRLKL
ncbi:MAG: DUF5009 domain-containing protein [Bacteroidetes bacterium]|nr:DUF5009 domain-containing protein [Bacteroidota bacterium]